MDLTSDDFSNDFIETSQSNDENTAAGFTNTKISLNSTDNSKIFKFTENKILTGKELSNDELNLLNRIIVVDATGREKSILEKYQTLKKKYQAEKKARKHFDCVHQTVIEQCNTRIKKLESKCSFYENNQDMSLSPKENSFNNAFIEQKINSQIKSERAMQLLLKQKLVIENKVLAMSKQVINLQNKNKKLENQKIEMIDKNTNLIETVREMEKKGNKQTKNIMELCGNIEKLKKFIKKISKNLDDEKQKKNNILKSFQYILLTVKKIENFLSFRSIHDDYLLHFLNLQINLFNKHANNGIERNKLQAAKNNYVLMMHNIQSLNNLITMLKIYVNKSLTSENGGLEIAELENKSKGEKTITNKTKGLEEKLERNKTESERKYNQLKSKYGKSIEIRINISKEKDSLLKLVRKTKKRLNDYSSCFNEMKKAISDLECNCRKCGTKTKIAINKKFKLKSLMSDGNPKTLSKKRLKSKPNVAENAEEDKEEDFVFPFGKNTEANNEPYNDTLVKIEGAEIFSLKYRQIGYTNLDPFPEKEYRSLSKKLLQTRESHLERSTRSGSVYNVAVHKSTTITSSFYPELKKIINNLMKNEEENKKALLVYLRVFAMWLVNANNDPKPWVRPSPISEYERFDLADEKGGKNKKLVQDLTNVPKRLRRKRKPNETEASVIKIEN